MFVLFNHNLQLALKLTKSERNHAFDYLVNKIKVDRETFRYFLTYLNAKDRGVERLVYATLCNSRHWFILKKIKETDFVYRREGGLRLSERSKYSKNSKIVTLVTICKDILSENRKDFFERMVESANSQSIGKNKIEHIVIDAYSKDGTQEYLEELASNGKIDYWVSESDKGIYNAMNKGPDFAYGDYILYLNSDDYLSDNAVESLSKAIDDNNVSYAFADAYKVNENEEKVGKHIGDINKVYFGAPYCHQTLLVKSDCFRNVKFDESYQITMWKYALELHEFGYKNQYVKDFLAYFRVGGISTDTKHEEKFKSEQNEIKKCYIVPRLNLDYQEYEFINHFFRRWSLAEFNVSGKNIRTKIHNMRKDNNEFVTGFCVAVDELTDINAMENVTG
jgi:glycosyltransferase involved in cell wall biosynthesis